MNIQQKIITRLFQKAYWDKYINDKRGFVMVLTLLLISLMSVLTITTFELVMSTTRITNNHKSYLQALYVADAGVEHTLYVLSQTVPSNFDWSVSSFENLPLAANDSSTNNPDWGHEHIPNSTSIMRVATNAELGSSYTVTLTMNAVNANPRLFIVRSLGTASGFQKTIVAEISPSARIITWMEEEL
jgi:Tfp pilus assembly protein PilX